MNYRRGLLGKEEKLEGFLPGKFDRKLNFQPLLIKYQSKISFILYFPLIDSIRCLEKAFTEK